MDSNQIVKSRERVRRSIRVSAIIVILTAVAFMNIVKRSDIRNVEILTILACGMAIGVFMVNLMLLLKLNKQRNLTGTGY